MTNTLDGIALAAAFLALVVVCRLVFQAISAIEGYDLSYETVTNDNPAVGIRFALFLLALILSFSQVIAPERIHLTSDLAKIAGYGALVLAVLLASRYVTDFLILAGLDNKQEVVREKNAAVAIVEGAAYLATAFVISGTLPSARDHIAESAYWLLIGQVLLISLGLGSRVLLPGLLKALDDHNQACALSLGGLLVASGIALGSAVGGDSTTFGNDVWTVAKFMAGWLTFMVIAQLITDRLMLPAHRLRQEVMGQANVAAGVIEGSVFVGLTLLYVFTIG